MKGIIITSVNLMKASGFLLWVFSVRKPILVMALVVGIFSSCSYVGSDKDKGCRGIVQIDAMVYLLLDIYMMEGYILANTHMKLEDSTDYFFAGVFKKHGISYSKFREAIDCYLFNQHDMDYIHEQILAVLDERQTEALRLGPMEGRRFIQYYVEECSYCFVLDICQ